MVAVVAVAVLFVADVMAVVLPVVEILDPVDEELSKAEISFNINVMSSSACKLSCCN